jgi:solute carrier family 35 protein C2
LATLSNPPSSSPSVSDRDDDDGGLGHLATTRAAVAKLVHPPTPSMEETPAINHARRRSSSLAGVPGTSHQDRKQKPRRQRSEHILEEGDTDSASDGEHSDGSSKTESTDLELDDMRSEDGLEDDEETGLTGRDRRRRRRRKRRNTRLDQRIVEDPGYSKEEEKLANQNLMRSILINAVLIGLW